MLKLILLYGIGKKESLGLYLWALISKGIVGGLGSKCG
jgi:hypothetical protein